MKTLKILILLMVVPVLAMAGARRDTGSTTDASGRTVVRIAVPLHSAETPPDWNSFYGRFVADRTNVTIIGEYWPETIVTERRNLMLASGDLPDLMNVTRDQAFLYGADGVFDPLDDYFARWAPNISRTITPDNSPFLKSPTDGKIYFIPQYNELNTLTSATFTYRRDILDEMGEPVPSTMDEWYQLFTRVKARYPNMIVLSERNRGVDSMSHMAFDMGKIDDYYGIIGSEFDRHRIVYLPITNEWRDMLQYYARLYSEGLLDPEYLTHSYEDWWERKVGGGRAFACWTMNFSRADGAQELANNAGLANVRWRVAETVKNYKTGERIQYKTGNPWQNDGFALNSQSRVKEAAVKFVDWFYSSERRDYRSWYKDDPDNLFRNYHGSDRRNFATEKAWRDFINDYGFAYFSCYQPHVVEEYPASYISTREHFAMNIKYVKIIPTIARTGDIGNWVTVTTDLQTYIETAMDEFITGRRSFSQWDAYVADVRRLGVDNNVAAVQSWYDDYWRSKGTN